METNDLIARLGDDAATDPARFGPKVANQALLGRAGLPIQSGFCLDAEAYRSQLKAAGLADAAAAALSLQGPDVRPYISEVRIGLFQKPITAAVLKPLCEVWQELNRHTATTAVVRSSALMEDAAGSTFAGQFETFLGLETQDDFLTAVRACWAAYKRSYPDRYIEYLDAFCAKAETSSSSRGMMRGPR